MNISNMNSETRKGQSVEFKCLFGNGSHFSWLLTHELLKNLGNTGLINSLSTCVCTLPVMTDTWPEPVRALLGRAGPLGVGKHEAESELVTQQN